MRQSLYATTALVNCILDEINFILATGEGLEPQCLSAQRISSAPDYQLSQPAIYAATVLISTLSECEPVIVSLYLTVLIVEFEPLTMGDQPSY